MGPKRPAARGGISTPSTPLESSEQAQDAPSSVTLGATPVDNSSTIAGSSRPASALKRLDSLNTSPLASPATRGRGAAGRPVARPRGIGRRSHKDRAELEKAEQERRQAEAATKARESAWRQRRDAARNRDSVRGRMRGGYAGDNERRHDNSSAIVSGPFSMGEVNKAKSSRPVNSGSGGRSGGGHSSSGVGGRAAGGSGSGMGSAVKQEHGVISSIHVKQEDGGYISSDAEDDGIRRLDVDNLIDLTGEDDEADSAYLPPVRIQRVEHKERVLLGTADAARVARGATADTNDGLHSTDRRRGKQRAKDIEITGESHRYRGTYTDSSSEDEGIIKAEPTADDGQTLPPDALHSPPTSPDTRRRAKERIRTGLASHEGNKPMFQTKEEELEWDIHERDLRILRTELGQMALPPNAVGNDQAINGEEDPRADKVYLFQLPAVLPGLVPIVPKAEAEDIEMQDVPEVGTTKAADSKTTKKAIVSDGNKALSSGLVGKLRVHASGKAYLDWGGIPMEVSMGQEANFLQDILVVDSRDNKANAAAYGEDDVAGMAMSMGQVKGKFVVTPEWDKIFEEIA